MLVPAYVPSMTAPLDDDTVAFASVVESAHAVTHDSIHARMSAGVLRVVPRG